MKRHSQERYQDLARKWLEGNITPEEEQEYADWYNHDNASPLDVPPFFAKSKEEHEKRILRSIQRRVNIGVPGNRRLRRAVVAAAAGGLLIIGFTLFYSRQSIKRRMPRAVVTSLNNDVAPGGNTAVLTLSNGKKIILGRSGKGILAVQGGGDVIKTESGMLQYAPPRSPGTLNAPVRYNTLITPVGGQYAVTLSDGTKVWLNANSSIRYPVFFNGKQRNVAITGEAYFEVAPDQKAPFVLTTGNTKVEVLGTHFNINAYDNEPELKVTLMEGSVKVIETGNSGSSAVPGSSSLILTRGQQAVVEKDNQIRLIKDIDVEESVAWKNGLFEFSDASLKEVLREMARWYNVKVIYEADPDVHLSGIVSRNIMLSQAIRLLQTNGVNCKIENGELMVLK
jgi:hypothetical protein